MRMWLNRSCFSLFLIFVKQKLDKRCSSALTPGGTGRGRPARPGHSGGRLSDLNGVFPASPCSPAHPGPRHPRAPAGQTAWPLLVKKEINVWQFQDKTRGALLHSLEARGRSFVLLERCNFIPRLCEELLIMVRDGCSSGTITASHSIALGGGHFGNPLTCSSSMSTLSVSPLFFT